MHRDLTEDFKAYLTLLSQVHGEDLARDDLAAEALERLAQLVEIARQLGQIDEQFGVSVVVKVVNESGVEEHYNAAHERDEQLKFFMRLLTEAYYYFAFRLRKILRNTVHPFHGLSSFESAGVRDVRNHLIEHPEGNSSRVFNRTFVWSQGTGMHLKTGRQAWEGVGVNDAGFIANSREFTNRLADAIERAREALSQQRGEQNA